MNKKVINLSLCFLLLMTLLITVTTAGAAVKDAPKITLSTQQSEFTASEDVVLTVTFANETKHSLRILKWFTPSDGLEEPVFVVTVNGEPVEYTGALYKRLAPTGNDYLTLKSGESISFDVSLADYYDLSVSGDYEVYYFASSSNLFTEKNNAGASLEVAQSAPVVLKVEGRAPAQKPATPTPTPPPSGTAFNGCTTTQQSQLLTARAEALNYATGAENYLLGISTGTLRYTTWFGTFIASRYNLVTDHFNAIQNAWANAAVTFDCKCKQNYYAYVYPTKPYTIYLCKVFWTAPMTGTDSKAGTLIHEMSHFNVVASTDDYVYGQTGAMNLAITNPDQAVDNADNHEYFAENNPAKP